MPQDAHPLDELRVDGVPSSDAPLHHVWNRCVGAGRANEALRADWQAQLREAEAKASEDAGKGEG